METFFNWVIKKKVRVLKLRAIKKFYNSFASANFLKSLFSVAVFKNCEERIKTAKKGGVGGGGGIRFNTFVYFTELSFPFFICDDSILGVLFAFNLRKKARERVKKERNVYFNSFLKTLSFVERERHPLGEGHIRHNKWDEECRAILFLPQRRVSVLGLRSLSLSLPPQMIHLEFHVVSSRLRELMGLSTKLDGSTFLDSSSWPS